MDPQILTALISAGSALTGACVGASATLLSARAQHRRTIASERRKEEHQREVAAVETCRDKINRIISLSHSGRGREEETDYTARVNEIAQLDREIRLHELYLPEEARRRVELHREALSDAQDLIAHGYFYGSVDGIKSAVGSHMVDVAVAVIRGTAVPPIPTRLNHIAIALDEYQSNLGEWYAEEIHEADKDQRKWIEAHPRAAEPAGKRSRLATVRRWLAKAISPDR